MDINVSKHLRPFHYKNPPPYKIKRKKQYSPYLCEGKGKTINLSTDLTTYHNEIILEFNARGNIDYAKP